ncbi:hypothetical protein [Gorillibacterium timonense]|uniref:hypothetical protein n=1 Tax=Gorillibacterium timonense TaxID=1689269 RepID=UPI0009ECB64E|nr:hypothetical protein [Gorillibacterium timonense]
MTGTKYVKLLGLVLGVAALNIIVFSPGFIGVELGASALATASGVTLLFASALVLLYGSYSLLTKAPVVIPIKQIQTHEDYVEAFQHYKRIQALEEDMALGLNQLERIRKKKSTLFEVLDQRFDPAEVSYKKFASVIQQVENLFYLNGRSMLNRLQVFDESEYASLKKAKTAYATDILRQRADVYNEHLAFLKSSIENNEEILLKLDKLLLEISRLDSLEAGDIEKMPCMQEIDMLIQQTKYYKN